MRDGSGDELEELGRGRWVRLVKRGKWEYAERIRGARAVMIIAVTDADELLLVEQPRAALGANTIELPAGLVGDELDLADEDPQLAAARELEEETGYRAAQLVEVAEGCSSGGITSERVTAYLAEGLTRIDEGGGLEGEHITVHRVPVTRVPTWLNEQRAAGKIIDLRVWSALLFVRASA